MSDPRVKQIKQALIGGQSRGGLDDIRVYMGPSRQYGQGFVDIICNIFRTVTPVIMRVGKTLFKISAKSLKKAARLVTHLSRPWSPHSVQLLNTAAKRSAN